MEFIGWFWTIWYSLLGLVGVLIWYVEFSGLLDLKESVGTGKCRDQAKCRDQESVGTGKV